MSSPPHRKHAPLWASYPSQSGDVTGVVKKPLMLPFLGLSGPDLPRASDSLFCRIRRTSNQCGGPGWAAPRRPCRTWAAMHPARSMGKALYASTASSGPQRTWLGEGVDSWAGQQQQQFDPEVTALPPVPGEQHVLRVDHAETLSVTE